MAIKKQYKMSPGKLIPWIFILILTLTVLSLTTPLTFKSYIVRNIIYFLTILLSFVVAKNLKNKYLRNITRLVPITTILIVTFYSLFFIPFANTVANGWKTVSISHRKINHSDIYVGQQMFDIGGLGYKRRIVKVVPVTPFLNWITAIDTNKLNDNWVKVNESYNPFHWK
jgi:hypothetical protein